MNMYNGLPIEPIKIKFQNENFQNEDKYICPVCRSKNLHNVFIEFDKESLNRVNCDKCHTWLENPYQSSSVKIDNYIRDVQSLFSSKTPSQNNIQSEWVFQHITIMNQIYILQNLGNIIKKIEFFEQKIKSDEENKVQKVDENKYNEIEKQRQENMEFYKKNFKEINEKYNGKYIAIIRGGTIMQTGDTFEDVKDLGMNDETVLHRFVFKVPAPENHKGRL